MAKRLVESKRWTDIGCRQIDVQKIREFPVLQLSDGIQRYSKKVKTIQFGLDFADAMNHYFTDKTCDETLEMKEMREQLAPKVCELISKVTDRPRKYPNPNHLSEYAVVEPLKNTITNEGRLDPGWKQVSGRLDAVGWNSNESHLAIIEFKTVRSRPRDDDNYLYASDVIQVVIYYMLMMRHLDAIEEKLKALNEDSKKSEKLRAISNMRSCQLFLVALRIEGADYQLYLYKVTIDEELQRSLRGGDLSHLYSSLSLSQLDVLDHPKNTSLQERLDQRRLLNAQDLRKRIAKKVNDLPPLQKVEQPKAVTSYVYKAEKQQQPYVHCLEIDLLLQYAVVRDWKEAKVLDARLLGESHDFDINENYKNLTVVQRKSQPDNHLGHELFDLFERSSQQYCIDIFLARAMNRSAEKKSCKKVPLSRLDDMLEVPMPHNHRSPEALLLTKALQNIFATTTFERLTSLVQKQDDPVPSHEQDVSCDQLEKMKMEDEGEERGVERGEENEKMEEKTEDEDEDREETEDESEDDCDEEELLKQNRFWPLRQLSETLSETNVKTTNESERSFDGRKLETEFLGSWGFCSEIKNTTNPAQNCTPFREGLRKMNCRLDTLGISGSTLYIVKYISASSRISIPREKVLQLLLQRSILKKQLNEMSGGSDGIHIRLILVVFQMQPSENDFPPPTFDFHINEIIPDQSLTSVMDQFDIHALFEAFADDLPPDAQEYDELPEA